MAQNRKYITSVALILLAITLIIQVSEIFIIPENAGREYLLDKIFHYGSIIIFYFSAAYLLSRLIKKFLWKSEFRKNLKPELIGRIEDLLVTSTYFISIGFIIAGIKEIEITFPVIIIFFAILIITIFLKPYFLKVSKTGFIQSVRPFKTGDWIKLHSNSDNQHFTGRVSGFDIRSVKLRSEYNTDLIIPNSRLNMFVVENFTSPGKEIKLSLPFKVDSTFGIDQAKRILRGASKDALNQLFENYSYMPDVLLTEISKESNNYRIDFYSNSLEKYIPDKINDRILCTIENHFKFAERTKDFNILKSIRIFDLLAESELTKLFESSKRHLYKAGEKIIEQGDPGESMFILQEGLLNVFIESEQKEMIKVGTISPGIFFGEVSLFTGEQRGATVVADTESVTLEIRKDDIKGILNKKPELVNYFGEVIAEREAINQKMLDQFNHRKDSFVKKMVENIRVFFNLR